MEECMAEKRPSRKLNQYGLTQSQENFCKLYIKYGISRKAYIEAYPKSQKWTQSAIDCEASKMLNNPKISQRLETLNEQATSVLMKSTALNKRKLLETALQTMMECNTPAERQHFVSLIKLLFQKEGMTTPETALQVNIQNNTVMGEVTDYLNL